MDDSSTRTNRRTVLQRGLAVLAGLVGLDVIDPESRLHAAVSNSKPAGQQPLRLYARRWQTQLHAPAPGELPSPNGRLNRQGDLLEAVDGKKSGEFYATCFYSPSSFGTRQSANASVELHTFKLGRDTLLGMGSPDAAAAPRQMYAIVGGTGRFAGARGTYFVSPDVAGASREYTEITITILS